MGIPPPGVISIILDVPERTLVPSLSLLLTTGQSLIIFIICLQSERIEKYQFELCPKYGIENMILTTSLD